MDLNLCILLHVNYTSIKKDCRKRRDSLRAKILSCYSKESPVLGTNGQETHEPCSHRALP